MVRLLVAAARARVRFSVRLPPPIADFWFLREMVRTLRIGLYLLPELPHVNAQVLRIGQIVPQLCEQEFVGEHLAGVLHEHAQQVILLGRELHLPVGHFDDTAHEVDREITAMEDGPLALRLKLMPQRRPHPRQELVHAERFGDVIVGTEIERLNLADLVAATGQDHDRNRFVARPHPPQQFQPLHIRQPQIENDQVGFLLQ